jgi:hypothetical protein
VVPPARGSIFSCVLGHAAHVVGVTPTAESENINLPVYSSGVRKTFLMWRWRNSFLLESSRVRYERRCVRGFPHVAVEKQFPAEIQPLARHLRSYLDFNDNF